MKGSLKGKRNTRKKPLKLFQKAMATILLLVSLTGYTACQQPPKNPDDDVVIVDPSNPSNPNNGNTQGENQGGNQGENQGGNQGGNQGEAPDNPIIDPDPTPIEEVTYVELLTTYEHALNMFIEELATQVMADKNIDVEDVTEYSCDFLGGNVTNTSVSSLNLEIKTETTTYKIAVTFDSPLTYTAISYFDTADAKGEACSKAISEATSEIVEEIKDQEPIEELTTEEKIAKYGEAIVNNFDQVLPSILSKYNQTDTTLILNHNWRILDIDEQGKTQTLQVVMDRKTSDTAAYYEVWNVTLTAPTTIEQLPNIDVSTANLKRKYYKGYAVAAQTEHLDIINAISAKLAEADNTFDYAGAKVIQGSWGNAISDTYGNVATIPLVYVSDNSIRQIYVDIKIGNSNATYYEDILSYLNQGKWYYGIEKDVALSDNQLAEIDLTTTQETNVNA